MHPCFEDPRSTLELEVVLDFVCSACSGDMGVTLKCAGKGLAAGASARAMVRVPCPSCACINQVVFAPDGTVIQVSPYETLRLVPEPSVN